jgi:nucleoside-diphosphate-sugar epimerase
MWFIAVTVAILPTLANDLPLFNCCSLVVHDVTEEIMLEVDQIYHLACPASPPHYQYNPVKTIKTSTM